MKKDIKAFLRRVGTMSFKRMEDNVSIIHKETGVSKTFIRADMISCALKSGIGYLDYRVFGFAANRDAANRATFMTMNHNSKLSRTVNDRGAIDVFIDKRKFNDRFRDFIGRDFIVIPDSSEEEFESFCKGKETVFAKVTGSFGGQGVEKIRLGAVNDYKALYERLLEEKKFLIEDTVIQHEKMESLCPKSVNTIRIVTVLYEGKAHYVYSLIRMGSGKNDVDNISSGGMYALLDENGVISKRAFCDKTVSYYEKHPMTGIVFNEFTVPFFKESIELCLKAALVEQRVGYVGWDVAVTENGPLLIEGNHLPSYEMCQNYGLSDSKTGSLPWFEKILGKDFFA